MASDSHKENPEVAVLAMQYSIHLPPNFDADRVRERVSLRRGLFDARGGLMHKSFLFDEKDHIYAPFYIWADLEKAQDFLLDELFHGVIETFSRQRVRSWFVLEMQTGDRSLIPTFACREIDPIPPEVRLERFVAEERAQAREKRGAAGLYMNLLALDADRWELMRFSLWADGGCAAKPQADCAQCYQVLHVSEPVTAQAAR